MPAVPKGAKTPTDRQKPAAQREAEGPEVAYIEWRDHKFEVPADPDDWPGDTILAFEEGKATVGLRALLGTKGWAEFWKTRPTKRDIDSLFEAAAEALGLESAGE